MRTMMMLSTALMLLGVSGAFAGTNNVDMKCCTKNSNRCGAFCRTPEGIAQGDKCQTACASFTSSCVETGLFPWRKAPASVCFRKDAKLYIRN